MKLNITLWREDESKSIAFSYEELPTPDLENWDTWRRTTIGPLIMEVVHMMEKDDYITLERVA